MLGAVCIEAQETLKHYIENISVKRVKFEEKLRSFKTEDKFSGKWLTQ